MDGVAVASVVSSALVGATGVIGAFIAGERDRRERTREARAVREHDREVARSARLFERRSAVYEELLAHLQQEKLYVEHVWPLIGPDLPPVLPERPSADDLLRLEARVSAFGSAEVQALLETVRDAAARFAAAASIYTRSREAGEPEGSMVNEMHESRKLLRELIRAISTQIRDELAAV